MLPSAGGTVEAAHMAAAASQSPASQTPTPLSSDAAAAHAATAWADQVIDGVGSPGRATTDVAEPLLPDVATLLQCAALQEDADAPRCNSPAFGTDQQQCDSTSPEEAHTDGAITPEHESAVSAVFTDEPGNAAATAGRLSAFFNSPMPASPRKNSEASCDSGLSACLDAALADSPTSSVGAQASAEQSLTRSGLGAQSPAAPSSPCSSGHVRGADQGTALSASACQAGVLSPSFNLNFLTNANLVRLDAHALQHDAASITAKFEDSLHLLVHCSEMHGLQRAHSARPHASLHSSSDDTAGHVSVAAEGSSFMGESKMTGLQQPGFASALYQSSQSNSVTSEDGLLASSGQGTFGDTPNTAHAWAPLGPDNSPEAAEGIKDLRYAFVTAWSYGIDIDSQLSV